MTKQDIIDKVKAQNFPAGSYVVFGSCPLAAADIRESADIDMLVSPELLETLKQKGWQQIDKGANDKPYTYDVFEAHSSWDFSSYSPTLDQLLGTADTIEGVPFASLQEVRKWKVASSRPKDLRDIELIDSYFAQHVSP
ncbi:MAG TPA: hypothetical protein VHD60_02590 [Candidatus Saccharimonadales bacterium]|nr:hypothetical protein [Candidatus Saccharimonadales bacterium]